jgi:hypothetical protein
MRKLWWLLTLVALLAGRGTPAPAQQQDCTDCCEDVCKPLGSVTVDLLSLHRRFTNRDLAFTTNIAIPGVAPTAGAVYFTDSDLPVTARINFSMNLNEEWTITGSFMRVPSSNQAFGFANTNVARQVTSATFPFGPTSVASTITGSGGQLPSPVTVPLNLFVQSQAPFYYLPLLPTRTLFNDPNGGGKAAGSAIGRTFEYTSNLAAGVPDVLTIQRHFAMDEGDLNLSRTWNTGFAIAGLGLGLQFASISHSYTATRDNPGAALPTRYDPQDGDQDLNSIDPQSRFEDGPDFDHYRYSSHFGGLGPKLGLSGTWPPLGPLQVYGKAAGSLVLGERDEVVTIDTVQNGTFVNRDSATEIANFDTGRLTFSRSLTGEFHHNRFTAIPEAEAEAGLTLHLGFGAYLDPILRVGGLVQYWHNAGSSTNPKTGLLLYGGFGSLGIAF